MPTDQLVFVKMGAFSGTNRHVEALLRQQFPHMDICVIDVRGFFRLNPFAVAWAIAEIGVSHRFPILSRDRVIHHLLRNVKIFDGISAYVRKTIARDAPHATMTVQTQLLFDAACQSIPNFIYTDSVGLTNLYYATFRLKHLPSARWLERQCTAMHKASRVFVFSRHVQRSIVELCHIPADKVVVIGAGSNIAPEPRRVQPASDSNKIILFAGVDWHRKGGPDLVAAFRRLPQRHGDATLLIVGCSPHIDCPGVRIAGRVPAADMSGFYRQAAIFCMPTRIEPFGIVFIEAMQHGVAVLAPRLGAMEDFITPGTTGMLHAPGDIAEIAEALTALLDDPSARAAMAVRGQAAISAYYTWTGVGGRLRAEIDRFFQDAASAADAPEATGRVQHKAIAA